ncbi:hypothetical protein JYU29_12735 [Tianweitania sp. BSSL-BM11]|uniref:Uncharacterized protein n=1 Tax=Tianweitania aestuarii TaxID=2814886 RepID=A0ABS5RXN4_9HYPH|nr:hypothetical protein [Tianweitania aestuarii]MBS9721550.1 hypothetical protein [Tianweitania aestuarii]
MKTLTLSALILAAAIPATAMQAYAGAASPNLSAAKEVSGSMEPIRVVRSASAPKSTDCEKATWPYIPASCLQREAKPQTSTISLNN